MNTMEAICSRKSVRSYTGEPVTAEELDAILQAANASPVGRAQFKTLHLTVITRKELLEKIEKATATMFGNPNLHPLYNAPMLILVSSQKPELTRENVAYSNAAIMVHNMALAATELGVGHCDIWGAVAAASHDPEILAELKLPEGFIPCCGICLGKTAETYEQRTIPMDRIAQTVIS